MPQVKAKAGDAFWSFPVYSSNVPNGQITINFGTGSDAVTRLDQAIRALELIRSDLLLSGSADPKE